MPINQKERLLLFLVEKKIAEEDAVISRFNAIYNELIIILNQKNGFTYNNKSKKNRKHNPKSVNTDPIVLLFCDYINIYQKNNSKHSFSLLKDSIDEHLVKIKETFQRRINIVNVFNGIPLIERKKIHYINILKITDNNKNISILNALDFKSTVIKYTGNEINMAFPEFVRPDSALMFDTIYLIKNENPHSYINNSDGFNNISNSILICCNNKIFNILYRTINHNGIYDITISDDPIIINVLYEYIERVYNE
jgi:hypothetical protein